jgi:hypothetical protein
MFLKVLNFFYSRITSSHILVHAIDKHEKIYIIMKTFEVKGLGK